MPKPTEEEAKRMLDDMLDDPENKAPKPEIKEEEKIPEETEKLPEDQVDDDTPIFDRTPRKQKGNPPEESIAALRKKKDELQLKVEEYEKKFGDLNPETVNPILDHLKENFEGAITEESVRDYLIETKALKEENETLKQQLSEKEKFVEEIDIQHSSEFKKNFTEPLQQAQQSILIEIANVGPDGKTIIGPKSTQQFYQTLIQGQFDGIALKAEVSKFKKAYKEETGEDHPELPPVNSLMNLVRNFQKKSEDRDNAYKHWGKTKEENKKKQEQEYFQNQERSQKENRKQRVTLASKAFREFPLDEEFNFIEEKEAKSLFDEEFRFGEKLFTGKPEDIPPYDEMISRGVRARLFDIWAPIIKKYLEQEAKEQDSKRSGIHKNTRPNLDKKSEDQKDWLSI